MDDAVAQSLRALLEHRPVAALATLHRGDPAVSMVPFVLQPAEGRLLIHVSALATHTADLQAHPRVAVLVTDEPNEATSPLALPRVALRADAALLPRDAPDWPAARAAYLARFADAELMFTLGDFSLVTLTPRSARLVAGFGQAHSLVGEPLQQWLCGTMAGPPG